MAYKTKTEIQTAITALQLSTDLDIQTNSTQDITGDILNGILDSNISLLQDLRDSVVVRNDDIVNTLVSADITKPLSAAQGKTLKDLIDALGAVAASGDFNDLINVPAASTATSGIIELATASEANALTDALRAITPATIPLATETQKGIVEQATQAEVNTGVVSNMYVTPATLQNSTQLSGKAALSHTHIYTEVTDFQTGVSANSDVTASKTKTDFITITGAVNLDNVPEGDSTWETLVEGFLEQTALTTALTPITQAGSFTPDYAIQALINSSAWGFASQDEAETIVSIILNLQTRVDELETKLQALGLLA